MMDVVINLTVAVLVVISAALVVARIRAQRRLEESQRKLLESHREFGKSLERLVSVAASQDRVDVSRRSSHSRR